MTRSLLTALALTALSIVPGHAAITSDLNGILEHLSTSQMQADVMSYETSQSVPEPASLVLFASGLFAGAARIRRQK